MNRFQRSRATRLLNAQPKVLLNCRILSKRIASNAVQIWNTDRIGACPNEGLYLEVLLEGFEEQFNLPAFSVNGGNRAGCEFQLVSQQSDFTLVALIPDRHQT